MCSSLLLHKRGMSQSMISAIARPAKEGAEVSFKSTVKDLIGMGGVTKDKYCDPDIW